MIFLQVFFDYLYHDNSASEAIEPCWKNGARYNHRHDALITDPWKCRVHHPMRQVRTKDDLVSEVQEDHAAGGRSERQIRNPDSYRHDTRAFEGLHPHDAERRRNYQRVINQIREERWESLFADFWCWLAWLSAWAWHRAKRGERCRHLRPTFSRTTPPRLPPLSPQKPLKNTKVFGRSNSARGALRSSFCYVIVV